MITPYIPYIVAFFALSAYALLGPIAKKVGTDLPLFTFITASSFILMILAGSIAYAFERHKVIPMFQDLQWSWLALFSLINLVAYVGYLWAINRIPVAQYEMFCVVMPVVGGLFAVFLLKEPFHARYILSLALMAVGLYIAIAPDLKAK